MKADEIKVEAKPYLLKNKIQHYDWGAKGEEAIIPKLLGIEPESGLPYAELWIGAHPKASSAVEINGLEIPLSDLIETNPDAILGASGKKKFGNKLPFLLKVLSASEALSIQAHPDKSSAAELHKKDPKNYPDDNHKPEIAIALDSLTALVGFKPLDQFLAAMKNYRPIAEFIGNTLAQEAENRYNSNKAEQGKIIRILYEAIIKNSVSQPKEMAEAIRKIKEDLLHKEKDLLPEEKMFLELEKQYGSDVGLFSLFLFNLVHLNKGEGIFLKAGVPHAYLKGNIIECMANSDNVVRVGLTPKFKDTDSLLKILSYDISQVEKLNGSEDAEVKYPVPIDEFEIAKLQLSEGVVKQVNNHSVCVILVIDGEIAIDYAGGSARYGKGSTILIPYILSGYNIRANLNSLLFRVCIPS